MQLCRFQISNARQLVLSVIACKALLNSQRRGMALSLAVLLAIDSCASKAELKLCGPWAEVRTAFGVGQMNGQLSNCVVEG